MGKDGYPTFNQEDMIWFELLVKGQVKHPEDVLGVSRRKAGLDLELVIDVTPRGRRDLTAAVCEELARRVEQLTRVLAPVVYVLGHPHPKAAELLAARG